MNRAGHLVRVAGIAAGLAICAAALNGCAKMWAWDNQRAPTRPVLRLTHHVGGTHERLLLHEGWWYQAFSSRVLVIDPATGRVASDVSLGEPGAIGPVVDLAIHGGNLYAVVADDEVVELALDDPMRPRIVGGVTADRLQVRPRRLSVVDDQLYVSGDGGVVRWSDGRIFLPGLEDVSAVRPVNGQLGACSGRRAYRLDDGDYLGPASDLLPLPSTFGAAASHLFVRRAGTDALVGLMTPGLDDVPASGDSIAIRGPVRRVRMFDDQIWIVSDQAIDSYVVAGSQLVPRRRIDVLGARDFDRRDENHLVVSGSFGRAVYRLQENSDGPGDTFLLARREASRLSRAHRQGAVIAAGSVEGVWVYTIGARAEYSEVVFTELPEISPAREASTVNLQARISPDGRLITITGNGGEWVYAETDLATFRCVASIDGEIWAGHDRGLTVLGFDAEGNIRAAHRLRLPGAVQYLYPLLTGGGATFVSEFGGFGVAEIGRVPIPPEELELMDEEAIEKARQW